LNGCAVVRYSVSVNREVILGEINGLRILKPERIIGCSPDGKRNYKQCRTNHNYLLHSIPLLPLREVFTNLKLLERIVRVGARRAAGRQVSSLRFVIK
jgi:hypothetical protein